MKISQDVIDIIAASKVVDNKLFLPEVQLDRKMYQNVDKALKCLGGAWNRKEKAHIFEKDIEDIIEQIIVSGEVVDKKKEFQFFPTPEKIVNVMIEKAGDLSTKTVLEPSAGKGAIASKIRSKQLDVVELMEENRQWLIENNFNVVGDDFMDEEFKQKYDVIIANPPFTKQQDVEHVTKMIELANERVIVIMSPSFQFRDNKKSKEFRDLLETMTSVTITDIDAGEFKESGTMIRTVMLDIVK